MAQEQAVPGWVIAAAFAVPAVIMLLVLRWALRGRARHGRHKRAEGRRRGGDALARGSAAGIADGGAYKNEALLRALSIKPEDHGPDEYGNPHDEGWAGTMLGLRSKISSATDLLEPHLYWGPRGRRPGVRPDGARREDRGRLGAVLRAPPAFDHRAARGRSRVRAGRIVGAATAGGRRPAAARARARPDRANPDLWDRLLVVGGPKGIVATRPSGGSEFGGWVYDLWLLERLAGVMELEPLANARVGPAWKVPYGLGRSAKAER